jgi:hypothetical protein
MIEHPLQPTLEENILRKINDIHLYQPSISTFNIQKNIGSLQKPSAAAKSRVEQATTYCLGPPQHRIQGLGIATIDLYLDIGRIKQLEDKDVEKAQTVYKAKPP